MSEEKIEKHEPDSAVSEESLENVVGGSANLNLSKSNIDKIQPPPPPRPPS